MLIFNALLFPTGSEKIARLDYLMCKDLGDVPGINWCKVVVDDIKDNARDLNEKFNAN
jgi:hypothetical protein